MLFHIKRRRPKGSAFEMWKCVYNGIASSYPFFIASISLFTNFLCFGISAIYHVFDWPSDIEIILQKLDHASISFWCFGMMFPTAFLLLPQPHGIQLICLCAAACTCNLYSIYISKPMIILSAAVPAVLLFYCDTCFIYMTSEEWIYMWCVCMPFRSQELCFFLWNRRQSVWILMCLDIMKYFTVYPYLLRRLSMC